jgi:hypothetical protein
MRKAQAQTITFILAVVTGALILVFGYKVLFSVTKNVDDLKLQNFKAALSSDVEQYAVQFGSYGRQQYNVPRQLLAVCFAGQSNTAGNFNCTSLQDYPLIKDSLEDYAKGNVFFVTNAPEPLYVPYVDTGACTLKCFRPKSGKLTIVLEGKGNSTLIS